MNKGFLFATSGQKIKSHVVESQITLLVWACLSLTEKQCTINHMIILMIQSVRFTSAPFEAFVEACFLVSALAKKNAETIKFLGTLENHVSENKIYFCLKKKSNVSLNKKDFLSFTRF